MVLKKYRFCPEKNNAYYYTIVQEEIIIEKGEAKFVEAYLLDSVILIWWIRKLHSAPDIVEELAKERPLYISSLSILEVLRSLEKTEEKRAQEILNRVKSIPVDQEIAEWAVNYLRACTKEGYRVDYISACIGATAVVKDLVIVTYNMMHYPLLEAKFYPLAGFLMK